jgi:hypothetical protein
MFANILYFVLFLTALKYIIIPIVIQQIVYYLPLKKDPQFHYVNIASVHEYGLDLSIIVSIKYTKLLFQWIWLKAMIPYITITDLESGLVIANITLSNHILVDGIQDTTIKQDLKIRLCEHVDGLHQIVQKILIGGKKEIDRITLLLEFSLSVCFLGILSIENVPCSKIVNIGTMERTVLSLHRTKGQL